MKINCIPLGHLEANCYVIECEETKKAAVIDPGGDPSEVITYLKEKGLTLEYIIDTHIHMDHIAGNDSLRDATGAKLLMHPLEAEMLNGPRPYFPPAMGFPAKFKEPDRLVEDGDVFEVGNIKFKVLHTPGHTRGGICLVTNGAVFTGDTLFNTSIGRSDFAGGNYEDLIDSIKTKLLTLPDDTLVLPGHMGQSTIGYERKHNPFLR